MKQERVVLLLPSLSCATDTGPAQPVEKSEQEPALSQHGFLSPNNPFPRSLAGDLPLVVPGLVFLEELRQPCMHRNGWIGVDAFYLHADEVAPHGFETRIALYEPFPLIVVPIQHLVDDLLGHIRKHVVAEQERHAQDRLHSDILAEYLLYIDLRGGQVRRCSLLDLIRARI